MAILPPNTDSSLHWAHQKQDWLANLPLHIIHIICVQVSATPLGGMAPILAPGGIPPWSLASYGIVWRPLVACLPWWPLRWPGSPLVAGDGCWWPPVGLAADGSWWLSCKSPIRVTDPKTTRLHTRNPLLLAFLAQGGNFKSGQNVANLKPLAFILVRFPP